jgi:hypothetical protein
MVQMGFSDVHHTLHVLDHLLELEVGMLPLVVVLVQPPDVLIPPFFCEIYQYLCAVEALFSHQSIANIDIM